MKNLKKRITMSGIRRVELARRIGVKYSTLSSYLNRYLDMPEEVRENIENEIAKERENDQ